MEEKVKSEAAAPAAEKNGKCAQNSDLRTFLIAFLTTVILLALYHFGMGVAAILSGSASYQSMPVTREYVLVPVNALPQRGPGMGMGGPGMGGFRRGGMPGEFRRGGMPGGEFRRGPRPDGEFRRGGFPRGPRPDGEAPAKPAPVAPEKPAAPAAPAAN